MAAPVPVEVVYALPDRQEVVALSVVPGATLHDAISASGLLQRFPEIDLARQAVGVFGHARRLEDVVAPGDRIEIYRPLAVDPKELRRRRARG